MTTLDPWSFAVAHMRELAGGGKHPFSRAELRELAEIPYRASADPDSTLGFIADVRELLRETVGPGAPAALRDRLVEQKAAEARTHDGDGFESFPFDW